MKQIPSGTYKAEDLARMLGSQMAIQRAVDAGELVLFFRGYYTTPDIVNSATACYQLIDKYFPEGVVSKDSILFHYSLFQEQLRAIHIDLPSDSSRYKGNEFIEFHRSIKITDVTTSKFNGITLKCYTPERAVFEVLFLEKGIGPLAQEVAANFVNNFGYGENASKLKEISKMFKDRGEELLKLIQAFHQTRRLY